jgi:hypothetical protein
MEVLYFSLSLKDPALLDAVIKVDSCFLWELEVYHLFHALLAFRISFENMLLLSK